MLEKRLAQGRNLGWQDGHERCRGAGRRDLLLESRIRCQPRRGNLHAVDAIELAAGLCWNPQAGVALFNLMTAEDICLHQDRVRGVVVNRTTVCGALPVDPIVCSARAVLDATGHEAVLVDCLRRRRLLPTAAVETGEGPMNATAGERFVIDHAGEIHPGLWLSGMSVSATLADRGWGRSSAACCYLGNAWRR